jgi:Niemann-Pick C1 protein
MQLIIATVQTSSHEKAPEILTDDNIKLLFDIQKKVDGLRANHSGSMVSLTDICMKPLGEDCATQSVLQYFKMKPENYDDYGGVDHVKYCFEVTSLRNISRLTDSYLLLDKKQIHTCIPQF